MKRILLTLIAAALLLPMPVLAQDAAVTVPGYSPSNAAVADPISITGPDTAKNGEVVTCRLAGTPTIDLSKPLLDQLAWLMGADQMFAYLAMPGQQMVPLDVEGTIVFGASGATMRPQVSFTAADPGEYRLIVDWNFGQNQLVEHVVTVEGDQVNPQPGPDPPGPIPHGSPLFFLVLETESKTADQETILLSIRKHLEQTSHQYRLLDPSQQEKTEWVKSCLQYLADNQVQVPALVASVQTSGTSFPNGVVCFSATSWPGRADEAVAWIKARESEVTP